MTADDAGKRTDIFVAEKFPQFARSSLRGLFDEDMVLVNGKPEEPGDKLRSGDTVTIDVTLLNSQPKSINLPVIFEDDNVVVINKPAGILTHSKGVLNTEATVASFISDKINDPKLTGNRAGIVHRLDRATSGVIITARNSQALSKLQKQFSLRKTKKIYIAVAEGIISPSEATIDVAIERNPRRPQTFRASKHGKTAQTLYKVIKTFKKDGREYSLVELKPVTGRTHQLRVHLSYIGHPIVGDLVYGNSGGELMLHASSLEITIPPSERKIFSAPLPDRIKEFAGI